MANQTKKEIPEIVFIQADIRQLEKLRAKRGLYNSEKEKLANLYKRLQMMLPLTEGQEIK